MNTLNLPKLSDIHGMLVAQAILPVCTNSCGSRTSNSCIFSAFSIAFSSEILISVQCSKGVVDVFLFEHCTLTAGFVMPVSCRNVLVVYSVHAFLAGRQLRLAAAPRNRVSNIVKMAKFLTITTLLEQNSLSITMREIRPNRQVQIWNNVKIREVCHDCSFHKISFTTPAEHWD